MPIQENALRKFRNKENLKDILLEAQQKFEKLQADAQMLCKTAGDRLQFNCADKDLIRNDWIAELKALGN